MYTEVVTYTSVVAVITATMCISVMLTLPGSYSGSDEKGISLGQALISKTVYFNKMMYCVAFSLFGGVSSVVLQMCFGIFEDWVWAYVILFTRFSIWVAAGAMAYVLAKIMVIVIGPRTRLAEHVESMAYIIMGAAFSVIFGLWCAFPKREEVVTREGSEASSA